MFQTYLQQIGLEGAVNGSGSALLNSFVEQVCSASPSSFSRERVKGLYEYPVPKMSPDGACSITSELEDKPYNLAFACGLPLDLEVLRAHPNTLRLWRLNRIVLALQRAIRPDWLGIYRKVAKDNGEVILLKEAYRGAPSRAEFPLTESFARVSNNATVGLTGKAVVVHDVAAYAGPYYECDAKVQSEVCCPIISQAGEILGIIDAESFAKDFFDGEKIAQIAKVCLDLGCEGALLVPTSVWTASD